MRMDEVICKAKPNDVYVSPSEPEVAFMVVANRFIVRPEWLRFKKLTNGEVIVDAPATFTAKDFRRDNYELVVK